MNLRLYLKYFAELFESLKKRSNDRKDQFSVGIRCQDDKNERLQILLRAGCDRIIRTGDWDFLHSKFFIDMWLSTKSTKKINSSARNIGNSNDSHGNDAFEDEDNKFGGIALTKIVIADPKPDKPNTTITVNALQLAILAKQSGVIESLMDHIFSKTNGHGNKSFNSIYEFLAEKVVLDFHGLDKDQFSQYDQSLNKMNALHLSCQYHPEAIKIQFDAIYKHKAVLSSLSCIVNDKENILGYAPLHIAAKKSFIDAAR